MPDERLELAYAAALSALSQQDTTLTNLRTTGNDLVPPVRRFDIEGTVDLALDALDEIAIDSAE